MSRVRRTGEESPLRRSQIATVVSEFLEKSPRKTEKSVVSSAEESSADFLKVPESVEGVKVKFGRGGRDCLRESGRMIFNSSRLEWEVKNSAVFISVEKFWELPPTIETFPDFCSGRFQRRSLKSGFSCFCQ